MKVVLVAATGQAGRTILDELVSRGHEVTAVARDASRLPSDLPTTVAKISDDLSSIDTMASYMRDADAVISAYGPPRSEPRYNTDTAYTDQLLTVTERLISAVVKSTARRLIVVGGAGSLEISPGVTVLDSGFWPKQFEAIAKSHVKAFRALKESAINWTYFSPPMQIALGQRTGKFRLGRDTLIRDAKGVSAISFQDYAIAVVDELENPLHERARFTVGY
ncbi:NAD(P)H-binding protein [Caballeronia sp. NCTM5]|uniref:NAD(P)-dependent oxidoreductase n=1 Tax=Caballeronia sp. NCTM5 TaxID=2921755 RepID=UPI0020278A3B|nr:NAD(P)H-binding protein [Caballeronia sp. NCTM5]